MLIKLFVAPFKKTYFEKDAFKVKSIQKDKTGSSNQFLHLFENKPLEYIEYAKCSKPLHNKNQ